MKKAICRRWAWTLGVLLLSAPYRANADDGDRPSAIESESEKEIQRGIELRRAARNQEALEAFRHAYALHPTPRASAQMALARQALADWIGAEHGLEDALRAGGVPWIDRYRDVLERALATIRSHLATLFVDANVTQGELLLNGSPGEPLPAQGQPIRVVAGTLRFEVRSAGFVAVQRTLVIAPEAQVHVVVTLDPIAPSTAARTAPIDFAAARGTPGTRGEGSSVDPLHQAARDAGQSTASIDPSRGMWGYLAFGAAGVLAAAGVVAWRVQVDNAATYNDDSKCLQGPLTRAEQCGRYANRANLALGLEVGAFGAAAASAGLGAWLLWAPARSLRSTQASTRCTPWSTVGVLCTSPF